MKRTVPTLYLHNNIFYPLTVIPLSVSDQTSKQMLLSCFENNLTIALYYPIERSKNVGTLGKILLVDHNRDGSLSVMVQGLARVKLLGIKVQEPYPQFLIEEYGDSDERSQTLNDSPLERLYLILDHWLQRHVHSPKERERFMKEMGNPAKLINNLCMLLIKDIELKQIFLESTSLTDRVRMMNALLVGDSPESEDLGMCEAIKNFERLETDHFKSVS